MTPRRPKARASIAFAPLSPLPPHQRFLASPSPGSSSTSVRFRGEKTPPPQPPRFLLYYVQVTRRMDSSIVSAGIFI